MIKTTLSHRILGSRPTLTSQRGQTMIFFVLGIGLVLLAVLGFAVDFGNMWFHRQSAQTAADAACTAAAMDMWTVANGTPAGNFTPGTNFDCAGNPTAAPCQYAAYNGYNGTGVVSGTGSNSVSFTFPDVSSFGLVKQCDDPPTDFCVTQLVETKVVDRVRTSFFGLVGDRTIDVPAKATCGLALVQSPVPILILNRLEDNTLQINGGSNPDAGISVIGGPSQSIQVNSQSTSALQFNGAKGGVDLSKAWQGNGADFGVLGTAATPPAPFSTTILTGTDGSYVAPHQRIADPLMFVDAPIKPNDYTIPGVTNPRDAGGTEISPTKKPADGLSLTVHGCPDLANGCYEYWPGYYPNGISVKGAGSKITVAIFQPGIYYLDGNLEGDSNSCFRPGTMTGDGSGGTVFYFNGTGSVNVSANSGKSCPSDPTTFFDTTSGIGAYPVGVRCSSKDTLPKGVPASISGSVLLAPCKGPDKTVTPDVCSPNCGVNKGFGYGDQTGGNQRGVLFFQNRTVDLSGKGKGIQQPVWQGGGQFLLAGTMYFHQCHAGGTDTGGTGCADGPTDTSAYHDQMSLGGNSGSGTYLLGEIIVDKLILGGKSNVSMFLNPNKAFFVYRASLFK